MHFKRHSELANLHARLSPSKYHWLNYSDERVVEMFHTAEAAARGSRLHDLAHRLIKEKIRLQRTEATLNMYVNDCIGWNLHPEVALFYSRNCFGHADAIGYQPRKKVLRISDLKTGVTPTSFKQLIAYAALFFLEYGHELRVGPFDVDTELRIYQNDEVRFEVADPGEIVHAMDRIKTADLIIEELREEVAW